MNSLIHKKNKRIKRIKSIRKHISGTADRPRISVDRSHKHIYAQIVNDETHTTLAAHSDLKLKDSKAKPVEVAKQVGIELGKVASEKGITKVVFDRRGYKYHGRVKALADGLRESGLEF